MGKRRGWGLALIVLIGGIPAVAADAETAGLPAFWGTRILNLPTPTPIGAGLFQLRISHRFEGSASLGISEIFGLDGYANVLVGLGYGISDRLSVTVARARLNKEVELGAAWVLAGRPEEGPFSVSLQAGLDWAAEGEDRLRWNASASIAGRLGRRLALLVVPAYASDTAPLGQAVESTLALGLGARFAISESLSAVAELIPVLSGYREQEIGWGAGLELKTEGHVFHLFVTSAIGALLPQLLPGGDLRLRDGDFRIGFNIFRSF